MSNLDRIIGTYRERSTRLMDALDDVYAVLSVVEGTGSTDQERQTAFNAFYAAFPDYDLSQADLFASIARWRELRTFVQNPVNFVPLTKTRV